MTKADKLLKDLVDAINNYYVIYPKMAEGDPVTPEYTKAFNKAEKYLKQLEEETK